MFSSPPTHSPTPLFLVDLGSPYAYLAAERIDAVVGELTWQAVLLGGIFQATGRASWAEGDPERRAAGRAEIERRAAERGLPPIRWPEPWPSDGLLAARVATWADLTDDAAITTTTRTADTNAATTADNAERTFAVAQPTANLRSPRPAGRAFIRQALRTHFADGRTLSDPQVVADAAAAAGLDPQAAFAGAADPAVKAELRRRTDAALAAGVFGVPAIVTPPFVLWGDDQLEHAATLLAAR